MYTYVCFRKIQIDPVKNVVAASITIVPELHRNTPCTACTEGWLECSHNLMEWTCVQDKCIVTFAMVVKCFSNFKLCFNILRIYCFVFN